VAIAARRAEGYREKGAPICCACAGEVYPFSRTLALLAGTDLAGFWAMRRVMRRGGPYR
jgi:hypothetical protein